VRATGDAGRAAQALLVAVGLAAAVACGKDGAEDAPSIDGGADASAVDGGPPPLAYPSGFPGLAFPATNAWSAAKAELGRHFFYDKRLSANGTQSCASCHEQARNFTDGRAHAVGSTGENHRRSAMALSNVGYYSVLTWASELQDSLEKQALLPLFGESPVELGNAGQELALLGRLAAEPRYAPLLKAAYPDDPTVTLRHLTEAIATFERSLLSGNAPYDRFLAGDKNALSPEAKRGADLFFGERAECFHCHGGFAFADSVTFAGKTVRERSFHNTGLYNVDGKGAYPASDVGLAEISGNPADMGRFRAPSLRNVAVTAPFMHDGSIPTLDAAIAHYGRGGTLTASGPNAGDGAKSPLKSELVRGFSPTDGEIADLKAFLHALTDEEFLRNSQYSDPWK
jgi:cytochrome c peroxidase